MQAGKERAAAERLGGDGRRAGTAAEEGPGRRRKDRDGDGRKPGGDDRKAEEGEMEEDSNDKRTGGDSGKARR